MKSLAPPVTQLGSETVGLTWGTTSQLLLLYNNFKKITFCLAINVIIVPCTEIGKNRKAPGGKHHNPPAS